MVRGEGGVGVNGQSLVVLKGEQEVGLKAKDRLRNAESEPFHPCHGEIKKLFVLSQISCLSAWGFSIKLSVFPTRGQTCSHSPVPYCALSSCHRR